MKTIDERGILNNYANEPAVYVAAYPTADEQRRYALESVAALVLVSLVLLTAFGIN